MKGLTTIIRCDITNALRDNMVIYILLAPFLLAIGLRVFLPSVEEAPIRVAVYSAAVEPVDAGNRPAESAESAGTANPGDPEGSAGLADRLERYAVVERVASPEEVRRRVAATDNIGGVIMGEDGTATVVLEGNEPGGSLGLLEAILGDAEAETRYGDYTIEAGADRSAAREYAAVVLVMLASLIGGLAVSFAMIDEKEQAVTRAFAVTPLSPAAYFAARGILAAIVGFAVATVGHLILVGTQVPLGLFLIALLAATPTALLIVLVVGGIARNQIQAVALLKMVMLVYLSLPLISVAVPRAWHPVFYILPNYWMFRTFEGIYVTGARAGDLPLAATVTFLFGSAVLVALTAAMRKQFSPVREIDARPASSAEVTTKDQDGAEA